jgi:hypothetical protein
MDLAEQKRGSTNGQCPLRSDCREEADKAFFTGLFEKEWEVFVIRRNDETNVYESFTLCCDAAA